MLSRRLRLSPELADGGATVAPMVAAISARELGWGATRCEQGRDIFLANAAREYAVAPPD